MTLLQQIKQLTLKAFQQAFSEHVFLEQDIEIAHTKDAKLGDYQCNSAMRFSKIFGKNPKEIAESVKPFLVQNICFQEIQIAGPGFINYKLSPVFLESEIKNMFQDDSFGLRNILDKSRVIVDFSSPNVAKEMHVGHLRSTIIGDCLARVFEFLGCDVLRLNHMGDWGTAFGMLICQIEQVAPEVLSGTREANLNDLMTWYKDSKKRFDEDEHFKKSSQLKVVALQQGDEVALKAWRMICDISARAYQEIYDLLDVKIIPRGESFYNPYLNQILNDLIQKGLVEESDGAQCIFLEGFIGKEGEPLPLMIQKSDGGFGYASTDMAAMWHRGEVEKADRIVIVTDAGQAGHFAMVSSAAQKAGYLTEKMRFDHVPFGLVLGADGKKFKTRSGETEKLIDLLNTAISESEKILTERGAEPAEIKNMSKILGVNAVKYADLSCNRLQDYQFSYERMLKFDGNTAAFIMYSLVRVLSIQRKVNFKTDQIKLEKLKLIHPSEIALALHLAKFSEAVLSVAHELYPHRLTDYLYQLAVSFNGFFRDCRVEGDPQEKSRLVLLELTAKVFKAGMELLGLRALQKM